MPQSPSRSWSRYVGEQLCFAFLSLRRPRGMEFSFVRLPGSRGSGILRTGGTAVCGAGRRSRLWQARLHVTAVRKAVGSKSLQRGPVRGPGRWINPSAASAINAMGRMQAGLKQLTESSVPSVDRGYPVRVGHVGDWQGDAGIAAYVLRFPDRVGGAHEDVAILKPRLYGPVTRRAVGSKGGLGAHSRGLEKLLDLIRNRDRHCCQLPGRRCVYVSLGAR